MNPNDFIDKKIANFKILKIIGEGAYSTVCLAEETIPLANYTKDNLKNELKHYKNKEDDFGTSHNPIAKRYVACKIIPRIKVDDKKVSKKLHQEIQIHKLMQHPNVVQFIDLQKDSKYYYIFLEYVAGGELFQLLNEKKKLSEKDSAVLFKQILIGLKYIHSLYVAHRDLKPQNILVDKFGRVKICDFGLSKLYEKNSDYLTKTPCGSPCYVSPECISGYPYNGEKSDIWSCGVILYTMVTGVVPWTEQVKPLLFEQISEGDFVVPSDISENCSDLIYKLMKVNFNQRISLDEALNHPFLKNVPIPQAKIEFDFEFPEQLNNDTKLKENVGSDGIETRKKITNEDEKELKKQIISF